MKRPLSLRMQQLYVPFDACYGACSDKVTLFLPPSRTSLGIIADTFREEAPLEFNPCEYFGFIDHTHTFQYVRPHNGYKDVYDWNFPTDGSAELLINRFGIILFFQILPISDCSVAINLQVTNQTDQLVKALFINPCLRYQNFTYCRGSHHENIFLDYADQPQALGSLPNVPAENARLLCLCSDSSQMLPEKHRTPFYEALLKSRGVKMVHLDNLKGSAISCQALNQENFFSLSFEFQNPLAFFSRSAENESGCIHVLPYITELQAHTSIVISGKIFWSTERDRGNKS